MPDDGNAAFSLNLVSYHQVLQELKKLRSDCSCGPDGIPVKFIKVVADCLASPLTHILNNCIEQKIFPSAWKIDHINATPKQAVIKDNNNLRPISILPVLSKIFECLVLGQMVSFLSSGPYCVLKDTLSAYHKGHSTTTALLAMKDDITWAMKCGEVTLAALADFLKELDTVAYEIAPKKLHCLGFSKSFLTWTTNYLTGWRQFIQIDDKVSNTVDLKFDVLQGLVLGPVLFNLYINDLSDQLDLVTCHQYADDTLFYVHRKPIDIDACERCLQHALDQLSLWSTECNLTLNPKKTKVVLFSTAQLAHIHHLEITKLTSLLMNSH